MPPYLVLSSSNGDFRFGRASITVGGGHVQRARQGNAGREVAPQLRQPEQGHAEAEGAHARASQSSFVCFYRPVRTVSLSIPAHRGTV